MRKVFSVSLDESVRFSSTTFVCCFLLIQFHWLSSPVWSLLLAAFLVMKNNDGSRAPAESSQFGFKTSLSSAPKIRKFSISLIVCYMHQKTAKVSSNFIRVSLSLLRAIFRPRKCKQLKIFHFSSLPPLGENLSFSSAKRQRFSFAHESSAR